MRITKLHILILLLLLGAGAWGFLFWKQKQEENREARMQRDMAAQQELARPQQEETQPAETPPAVAAPPAAETSAEAGPLPSTYTVLPGDTLWKIAKMREHFGQGRRWYDIWKANEEAVFDFDRIEAGQSLAIPLDKPEGHPWPATSEKRKQKILSRPLRPTGGPGVQ